jgi:hypothetical protein
MTFRAPTDCGTSILKWDQATALTGHDFGDKYGGRTWWAGGGMQLPEDPGGDFVEVMAELRSPGGRPALSDWCAARDLTCSPMVAGMLISGSRGRLEAAFGQELPARTRSTRLAPPAELRDVVESMIVMPVPHLHRD